VVRQGGPRQVWDEVEAAFDLWQRLDEPPQERFGMTVSPEGDHWVWLDEPRRRTQVAPHALRSGEPPLSACLTRQMCVVPAEPTIPDPG
jgi:hypothetical protein